MVYGEDSSALLNTLIRMILSDSSRSTVCLMHSMLAVSSLYLHGLQAQSIKYHTAALQAMRETADIGLTGVEPCEHVAAAMLLGSYEVCFRTSSNFCILPTHQKRERRRASLLNPMRSGLRIYVPRGTWPRNRLQTMSYETTETS